MDGGNLYLRTDEVPADMVFAEIVNNNNLVIVKNYLGRLSSRLELYGLET